MQHELSLYFIGCNLDLTSGYAGVIAEIAQENVHIVEFYDHDPNPPVKW